MADISEVKVDSSNYNIKDEDARTELQAMVDYIDEHNIHIWGLEADFANSTFTRLEEAVGKNGGSDFDNCKPWKRRRCNLADDGTVNAYLGETDYVEDGTNGQVMVEQPKFWYKVEPITLDGVKIRKARYYVASGPAEGFKVHPAFIGMDGTIQDCVYEGAYEGYVSSSKLCSQSGVTPTGSYTRGAFRTYAANRGAHWRQTNIQIESMDQLLMVIEYGQFNMQDAIGFGYVDTSNTAAISTGTLSSYGNGTYGNKSTKKTAVQWRGKENMWGNKFAWVDGININSQVPYIANSYTYSDDTTTNYTSVGFQVAGGNYISAFGYSSAYDWLFLAAECSGNSSTPIGDYAYQGSGWRVARLGGSWGSDLLAGPFYWSLSGTSSGSGSSIGGRCAYIK